MNDYQFVGAPQRMSHALLVQRLHKTVIGGGAVVDQSAGVVQTDDFLQSVCTAVRVNDITGSPVSDPGMEPDGSAPLRHPVSSYLVTAHLPKIRK